MRSLDLPRVTPHQHVTQEGRSASLFCITYNPGDTADWLVIVQQRPTERRARIRVVEVFQGEETNPSALERARAAFETATREITALGDETKKEKRP